MKTIGDILTSKGDKVVTISPEAYVLRAVELMAENNIGGLVVIEDDAIKGIVTERDYLRKIIVQGRRSIDTKVKEIMSTRVIFVTPDQTFKAAMAIMSKEHIRHLPVMEDSKLVGVVSIGDLTLQVVADQEVEIQTLQNYISDNYPS